MRSDFTQFNKHRMLKRGVLRRSAIPAGALRPGILEHCASDSKRRVG